MDISYVISPYPEFAGQLRAVVYAADDDSAEVDSQVFDAPHDVPRAISFSGLDQVAHRVVLIGMPATVLHDWWYYPKRTIFTTYSPIYFQIGDGGADTPLAGTSEYRNDFLAELDYWVERRGPGSLIPNNTGILSNKEIDIVPEGGFDLVLPGDVFNDGETFIIHIQPTSVSSTENASVAGKWFEGSVEITEDTAYITDHLKKLIKLRGPLTYSLPAGSLFPKGYVLCFQTHGSAGECTIETDGVDEIEYSGGNIASYALSGNEFIALLWDGTLWQIIFYVMDSSGGGALSDNYLGNDSTVGASTAATKALFDALDFIIASGIYNIGNIAATDSLYTITHSLGIAGDYLVLGSFKSNGNYARDNALRWAYKNPLADSFQLAVQGSDSETENVEFAWVLVKL